LALTERDGKLLWHCFGGCSQEAVAEALRDRGLLNGRGASSCIGNPVKSVKSCEMRVKSREDAVKDCEAGLTVAELATAKKLPEAFLRSLGLRDVRLPNGKAVAIPYLNEYGSEIALRYRLSLNGDNRFRWRRGANVQLYGLQRLKDARKAGGILIVEGESDCWTAWYHNIPAIGVPGKSVWRSEWAAPLKGLTMLVWQEPDAVDFTLRIAKDLPEARIIEAPDGIKDISDAHCQGKDIAALLQSLKVKARRAGDILEEQATKEQQKLAIEAASVLNADDPLVLVENAIRGLGYGGDIKPAIITYLCLTTRLLAMRPGAMPGHLLIVGPPSAGKSYTLQTVLRLMPESAHHTIDAGSPRLLIYDNADIQHRVVVFSEADSLPSGEDNPAASAIRNLLQDHRLHYGATIKDKETGEFTVKEIDKPGPTVMVTTAVKELGGQLGSRLFILPVPEDVNRIQAALATQAELEVNGATKVDPVLVAYQAYLQSLAPIDVIVPFAPQLAEEIGKSANATRILRDFQRLLALIKSVTILRIRHRERNADGRLIATIDDYAVVYELVAEMYEASLTGATEQVRAVVEAVASLRADGVERVTYSKVAERVGLHPEQVKRLAKIALKHGWLLNSEDKKHRPANLSVGDPIPEATGLPAPEKISHAFHNLHGISQRFTVSQPNREAKTHTHTNEVETCEVCGIPLGPGLTEICEPCRLKRLEEQTSHNQIIEVEL